MLKRKKGHELLLFSETKKRLLRYLWAFIGIWTGLSAAFIYFDLVMGPDLSGHFLASIGVDLLVWLIGLAGIARAYFGFLDGFQSRERAENALRASEERYRLVVDMLPDAVAVHSGGKIVFVNSAAVKLMGAQTPADLIGRPVMDFVHPDSRAVVAQRVKIMMETGQAVPLIEEKFLKLDGTPIAVEVAAVRLSYEGQPAVQVVIRDIADRKLAEQEREESNRRLRDTLEGVQLIAIMLDLEGRITFCNDYLLDLTGWTYAEIIGKNWFDSFIPADEKVTEWYAESIRTGEMMPHRENTVLTRSGQRKWIAWSNTYLRDLQGRIIGITSIGQDITERKQLETTIETIEKGLSAKVGEVFFDSMVTHLAQALESDYTFIGKILPDQDAVQTTTVYENGKIANNFSYELENSPCSNVVGQRLRCYPENVAGLFPDDPLLTKMRIEGYVGVPLFSSHGEAVGIMVALYHKAIGNPQFAQSVMAIFGARAAAELERQSAVASIERHARAMTALYETSLEVNAQTETQRLLPKIVERAARLLNAHLGGLYLMQADNQTLEMAAGYNLSESLIGTQLKPGEGLAGKIVQDGQPITIPDYQNWPGHDASDTYGGFRRMLGVPLKVGERVIGVITIADKRQIGAFSEEEIRLASLFADQAAIAVEKARLYREVQRESSQYRTLFELANDAVFIIDPQTQRFINVNQAATLQLGYSRAELLAMTLPQIVPPEFTASLIMDIRQLAQTGSNIFESMHRCKDGRDVQVEVSAHVIDYGGQKVFQSFARDITERKRADRQIEKQLERISALRQIDSVISASLDMQINLSVVLDQAITHLGVDAADVLLYNPKTMSLNTTARKGFKTAALRNTHLSLGQSYAGRAARERHTIHIANLEKAPGFHVSPEFDSEHFITYFAVPLIVKGEVKGVMELFHRARLEPDAEWLNFMETLAGQAAIAIDNATLFENLQRTNVELALAYDNTIESWAEALELRQYETPGHCKRVSDLTVRLATELGLSPEQTADIRRGALLHDVGKMGIPEHILNKTEPLTPAEWDAIKQHPLISYQLLARIAYLKSALAIPHYHHERWDGSGYPYGMKGEEIPLAARLFSVIDVWDSLISDRPFRLAWTRTKALAYIKKHKGTAFDPRVVEAFVRLVKTTDQLKDM
jgi:PAS domain S-box-containing protein